MASYDKYNKRIERLQLRVEESRGAKDLSIDDKKLNNPIDNMEYIYTLLSENKILLQLGGRKPAFVDLEELGLKIT